MDEERTARVAAWLKREVARHACVERVWIFGSRARGDNREKSDFDIAVSAPSAGIIAWDLILETLESAPTLLRVDVLRYEGASEALRSEIDRDGVEVYARESRAA